MLLDSVSEFRESLRRTHADTTRRGYTSLARTFLRTLPTDAAPADITEARLWSYLEDLEARDRRPRTRTHHLYALRAYCAWLVATGKLPANPAEAVTPPPLDDPVRAVPTDDQVRRLMEACDSVVGAHRKALARAVVTILCYSGVRRNELMCLELPDINLSARVLKVRRGKGGKPRSVKIGPAQASVIAAYQAVRPVCRGKDGQPIPCKACAAEKRLLMLRCHIPMADEGLRTLLRDLQDISKQPGCEALLPHGFRHHFASRLDAEGATIYQIKEILGHKETSTTEKYIHVSDARFAELAELVELKPVPPTVGLEPPPPAPAPITIRPKRRQKRADAPAPLRLVEGGTKKERPGA